MWKCYRQQLYRYDVIRTHDFEKLCGTEDYSLIIAYNFNDVLWKKETDECIVKILLARSN